MKQNLKAKRNIMYGTIYKQKKVLLFNSKLKLIADKLRSRWDGPFVITNIFPYGCRNKGKTKLPHIALARYYKKWKLIQLPEFSLKFEPRGAKISQALVDFIMEMVLMPKENPWWTLYVDGSSNPKKRRRSKHHFRWRRASGVDHCLKFNFKTSHIQAKYEALLAGLSLGSKADARKVLRNSDSQLVVEYTKVVNTLQEFEKYELKHIPREDNLQVGVLSKLASTKTTSQH
ncbi:hypothetical protein CR513_18746, partial [Mucuna pruriens]